ncbi:MAG: hypothetical protein EON94_05680 [Caulobacteraceae bacterium]|nr:MAG: hypothetical protein EON94_05680 [Caulobacteraceae bacterium]
MNEPSTGDVFLIPLDEERCGIGQVAGEWESELYVVVYDKVVPRDAVATDIDGAGLQFAALTLDAKFYHGDWQIIGNRRDNLTQLPQPWFKVRISGVPYIEARDRSVSRPATAEEASVLRNRTVSSPAVIEGALRAYHGLEEWLPHYDKLRADYACQSSRLLGG